MPEPASSFMVGNAPGGVSYAPPLLNFAPLANLPNAYYQGQQNRRQLAMANAFPNGVPLDANGNPDINQIVNTGAKLGGLNYLQGLLPYMYEAKMGQSAADAINGPGGSQPASASSSVPGASGPAHIRGSAQPQQQPQLSTVGADNNGSDTLRSVAVESFGGKDVTSLLPRFAQALGVDPDQPLSPQQVSQARTLMGRTAQNMTGNTASDTTGGGAPVSATGGASGSPAPAGNGSAETAQPSAGIVPQVSPAASLVPQGADPLGYANALNARAQALRTQAARYAAFPNGANQAKVLQEQAQNYDDRAKQIMDTLRQSGQSQLEAGFKAQQPTDTQKNLQSGVSEQEAVLKGRVTQSQKTYNGIQALANQYESDQKPYLELSRSILNDPRMYTGTAGNLTLDINRVRAAFGDQRAAMLQEALQKVTASSVLGQINQQRDQLMEAGGTSGRIFAQQVDLVEKAAPQLATTLGGNRFLVEVQTRMGELNTQIRNMALQYMTPKQQGGLGHNYLDPGFDKMVADYLRAHPVFSKEELANPALLGAPTAPAGIANTQDRLAWGNGIGLKPGDPFRAPNGQYKYWQQPKQ